MNDGWNNQKYFWWVAFGFGSVNMINTDFSSMEKACFVSCIYVLQVFDSDGVIVELCCGICSIIKSWCVVRDVDSYPLCSFYFEGEG